MCHSHTYTFNIANTTIANTSHEATSHANTKQCKQETWSSTCNHATHATTNTICKTTHAHHIASHHATRTNANKYNSNTHATMTLCKITISNTSLHSQQWQPHSHKQFRQTSFCFEQHYANRFVVVLLVYVFGLIAAAAALSGEYYQQQ